MSARSLASRRAVLVTCAALGLSLLGCGDQRADPPAPPATVGEGGSPFALDSALKLFRVGLEPVEELESASLSLDDAVGRFADMIEKSDTSAMRAMVMSRREFAYLYYPTSAFTRPPMKQEPGLVWFFHIQNSQKGATRLLDRYGGRPLRLVSNSCKGPPRVEGENRLWYDCMQRVVDGNDTTVTRLFGGIYERSGRFKIFSYSNDL